MCVFGVWVVDGVGWVVFYLYGGVFVMCGLNLYSRIVNVLLGFVELFVLIVDYWLIFKYLLGMVFDDCYDVY